MASPININIPHQLGVEEAKRRIERGFGELQSQIAAVRVADVHKAWEGDLMRFGMKVAGQGLTGRLTVLASAIHIEIELPGILGAIANTIKGRLQKHGQLLLEKK
jgi:hypothetical protein